MKEVGGGDRSSAAVLQIERDDEERQKLNPDSRKEGVNEVKVDFSRNRDPNSMNQHVKVLYALDVMS